MRGGGGEKTVGDKTANTRTSNKNIARGGEERKGGEVAEQWLLLDTARLPASIVSQENI